MKAKTKPDPKSSLLERIRVFQEQGSKSNQKISAFILQHHEASTMTALTMAKQVGVSEATVVRFAKGLGFNGYPELMEALRATNKNRLTSIERLEIAGERLGTNALEVTLNAEIRSLKATLEAVDPAAFDQVVKALLEAKNVYIVATRSSTSLADYMYFYMSIILDHVHLVQFATGPDLYEQLLRIGAEDALIGITFPRYSRRTVEAMRFAKKNGARTIGITDSASSPVVRLSDDVLYARNDVTSFVDSLVAPMALINALVSELGRRRKEETKENLAKLERLWAEHTVYDHENDR